MRRKRHRIILFGLLAIPLGCLPFALAHGADKASKARDSAALAPLHTDASKRVFLFRIPAPRGRILDRSGRILAGNESKARLGLNLTVLAIAKDTHPDSMEPKALLELAKNATQPITEQYTSLSLPTDQMLLEHWENRPLLPLYLNGYLEWTDLDEENLPSWMETSTIFLRRYPAKSAAAHVIGYASRETPRLAGEFVRRELLWPTTKGRDGLEKQFDQALTGKPGLLSVIRNLQGEKIDERVLEEPEPGYDLVTTLNLPLQKLAQKAMAKSERNGAVAMIDAESGDVLALHSEPDYDPNEFIPSVDPEHFQKLVNHPDAPLMPRAYASTYPPGSTFKPIVALAGLHAGAFRPTTQYSGAPYITIDGRRFHNWNDEDEGSVNMHRALQRSTNTWFYQAGLETGSQPILDAAKSFGFGAAPDLKLETVASGVLPDSHMVPQGIANLSIGQGSLLVSPLQVAAEMATFANETHRPTLRLIAQIQNAEGEVIGTYSPEPVPIQFTREDIREVKEGMYRVVNTGGGTGAKVRLDHPTVLGKTGTSQWSSEGTQKNAYWFAGFVHANDPRLAFAVLVEGEEGEDLYSSQVAAPVASEIMEQTYGNPKQYAVTVPSQSYRENPSVRAMRYVKAQENEPVESDRTEKTTSENSIDEEMTAEVEEEYKSDPTPEPEEAEAAVASTSSSSNRSASSSRSRSQPVSRSSRSSRNRHTAERSEPSEPTIRRAVVVEKPKPKDPISRAWQSVFD